MRDEDQPSGDPENSGPAPWSEKDWATYLRRQDLETARFLAFYQEAKGLPDRLDVVARRMGWEPSEWSPTAEASETEPDMEIPADLPYCIHQHPVFVAARSLTMEASTAYRTALRAGAGLKVPPLLAAETLLALWDLHHQVVMAVNATDTGDLALAIVHLRRALGAVNTGIGLLAQLPLEVRLGAAGPIEDAQSALFDLRDICLRVQSDCRWGTEG